MTSNKDVHVSGAAQDGTDIKRRNVPGGQNGAIASSEGEIDDKKLQKVPSMTGCIPDRLS